MLSYPRAYVCKTYNKRQIPLSCVQTGATFLANNSQHCWMLDVGSLCTLCCILLDVVVFRCAKFETCQTFSTLQTGATLLANKSYVVGYYMLRPFAHPIAFCWMLLRVVGQSLKPVKLLAPCKRAHFCWPTSPNIVAPTMLGVVARVLAVVCKRMQQLPTMLGPAVHSVKDTTHKSL